MPSVLTEPSAELLTLARSGRMALPELLQGASALHAAGHADASAELYAQWIAHTDSPLRHVACFNWGTVLAALQRPAEAEAAYRQSLALAPDFLPAQLNLGHQLERRGDTEGALDCWRVVIDRTGEAAPARRHGGTGTPLVELRRHAMNNSARLLELLRRYDEAESLMRTSLDEEPGQFDVIQHWVHIRQKQCRWPAAEPFADVTANRMLMGTSALAMLSTTDDPALQLLAADRHVQQRIPGFTGEPLFRRGPVRSGRVRIGYLSGDLHLHAVGLLTAEVFGLHDRSRFEVHAFCWSRDDGSDIRARIVAGVDRLHRVADLADDSAARLIAEQGIDVLVDLQGLTSGARPAILVQRPAPVQVSWLGFPGTCALPGVDWIVADPYVMPPSLEPLHTERPLRVPTCYQPSDRQRIVGPTPSRAACGLPEDAFVYCSFNNNHKMNEPMFAAWMRVLSQVPGSVLWLLADNRWAEDNLRARARACGVEPDRLVFAPRVAPSDYLARFQAADLVLDTFPYNAGATANDVLWAGVPILTLSGRAYISRMCGSLLHAVGLPDLVTETLDEYERVAIAIGRHPARAASYRRYLAEQGRRSALFDTPRLVRELESAFEDLALRHR